jgi:hypothetical protein
MSEQPARHDPVADLLALTSRLGERLVTARREVDAIDALLGQIAGRPVPSAPSTASEPELEPRVAAVPEKPAPRPAIDPVARTRAIALALDGHDRAEAQARLAAELDAATLAAVLDDVFGPA